MSWWEMKKTNKPTSTSSSGPTSQNQPSKDQTSALRTPSNEQHLKLQKRFKFCNRSREVPDVMNTLGALFKKQSLALKGFYLSLQIF
jgi:hypothetical protein